MKKSKEVKPLSISDQLKSGEISGAKVAKIMNAAKEKVDKLLAPLGYGVNFQADFYKIEPPK